MAFRPDYWLNMGYWNKSNASLQEIENSFVLGGCAQVKYLLSIVFINK